MMFIAVSLSIESTKEEVALASCDLESLMLMRDSTRIDDSTTSWRFACGEVPTREICSSSFVFFIEVANKCDCFIVIVKTHLFDDVWFVFQNIGSVLLQKLESDPE